MFSVFILVLYSCNNDNDNSTKEPFIWHLEKFKFNRYSTTEYEETYVQEVGFRGNTVFFKEEDEGITYKTVFKRQ